MKGLLIKDFTLYFRIYGKIAPFLVLIFSLLGLATPGFSASICALLPFYALFLPASEVGSRWNFYACALPISRAKQVASRFLFVFLILLSAFAVSLVSGLLPMFRTDIRILEVLASSLGCALFILPLLGLALTLDYKFGPGKSRMLISLLCLLPLGLLFVADYLNFGPVLQSSLHWIDIHLAVTVVCFVLFCLLSYLFFLLVSIRIYKKQDF